jgi:hypothetical protein
MTLEEAPEDVVGTKAYRQAVEMIRSDPEAFGIDTKAERQALKEATQRMADAAERLANSQPTGVPAGEDR